MTEPVLKNEKVLDLFESTNLKDFHYNPYCGIIQYNLTSYCEHIHNQAKIFFAICDKFEMEYVVFAGSSVGMVRNKSMMPWTDDYDIIILDKHKPFFFNSIMPILKQYGFKFWGCGTKIRDNQNGTTFVSGSRYVYNTSFRLDIFWSTIDKCNNVKNVSGRGEYHKKNLSSDIFFPSKYYVFNGITIPFGNDVEQEVLLSYGDVRKNCLIYSHVKGMKEVAYDNWQDAISDYDSLKLYAIQNTKNKYNIDLYCPSNRILLLDNIDFKYDDINYNSYILIVHIVKNGIDTINCVDFLRFKDVALLVLFYFPNIKINLFIRDLQNITYFDLNYATHIYTYNSEIKMVLDNLIYINKPVIEVARVITIRTYDLFHLGHRNIIDNCKLLSPEVIIGVSTDELNKHKGKQSHESFNERMDNTKEYSKSEIMFNEESLELKPDYMKRYNCNILVMGDDWENVFNSDDYECVYFKRTPDISSTLLRNELYS